MSQNTEIAKALKRGWVSPLDALQRFGTLRLAARIWELERDGMNIERRIVNRGGKHYAEYRAAR